MNDEKNYQAEAYADAAASHAKAIAVRLSLADAQRLRLLAETSHNGILANDFGGKTARNRFKANRLIERVGTLRVISYPRIEAASYRLTDFGASVLKQFIKETEKLK